MLFTRCNPLNAIIAISEALFEELKENGVGLTVYRDHIKGRWIN